MYWAKGTGFGTGSTQQSWDVEQALLRQKSEEEHVTVLLQVNKFAAALLFSNCQFFPFFFFAFLSQILSSYINPGDCTNMEMSYHDTSDDSSELPPIFLDLLQHSCLIPALCSYLRNDSGNIPCQIPLCVCRFLNFDFPISCNQLNSARHNPTYPVVSSHSAIVTGYGIIQSTCDTSDAIQAQ